MTIKAVLSWELTPLSGSFKLERGPTDLVVRLGIAAAKILVSQIQMATLRDSVSLEAGIRWQEHDSVSSVCENTPGLPESVRLLQRLGDHGADPGGG